MVNRSLLVAALILFLVSAIEFAPAVWRGPPQVVAELDPETRNWVRELRNKYGGPCCDTADGYPVEVDGWDMAEQSMTYPGCPREGRLWQERLSCSIGRWQMARRPELRIDRSENQQAW
jgi:hypothetical protein